MATLIDELAAVCREHFLTEKVLVVPSLAVGHQIADRVAYEATSWVNLRAESTRSLADAVIGFDLVQEGRTVLSRAQALALVDAACDRVLKPNSYFGKLADQQGLYRAVQRTIDDLRHAGARPAAVTESAFEDPRKRAELDAIVAAYEEELRERQFVDRAGVLQLAVEKLRSQKRQPSPAADSIWMLLGSFELTPIEQELIELLSNGRVQRVGSAEVAQTAQFDFFRAVGEENEVREVFRRSLQSGALDQSELIYSQRATYLPMIHELAREYDVECTFADGVASSFTRPGQAAVGFLRWIASDFDAFELRRIFTAGAVRSDGDVTPLAMSRVLRNAAIGWGRDRYEKRLAAYEAQERLRSAQLDRIIATRAMIARILAITADVRTSDGVRSVDVPSLAASASAFVAKFARTASELDGMAVAAIRRMLDELAVLPAATANVREGCDRLIEAVRQLHVGASNPRPGHLHVASLRNGGYSGRRHSYVVGLDDSKSPGAGLQDPILLDRERRAINDAIAPRELPIVGDQPQRNVEMFRRLMSLLADGPRRTVTLSYSMRSLLDEREQFPASVLLDAYRAATAQPTADYETFTKSITQSAFIPERPPLSESEWWLSVAGKSARAEIAERVRGVYPWLADGAEALAARESDAMTAWDGKINVPGEVIDPRLSGAVMSSSQLEQMAKCPFAHFMRRILGVKPLDELRRDPHQWLESFQLGAMLHTIFQRFMEEITARGEKPSFGAHRQRLLTIATEELAAMAEEVPPPNEESYEARRVEVEASCEVFLRSEEAHCADVTPRWYEVPFGFDEPSEIGSREPLAIELAGGRRVLVRGKIDRVDEAGSGIYDVWDYKTGDPSTYTRSGYLHGGTMVQHAVYARAIEELLARRGKNATVRRSGYFFPSARGEGARVVKEPRAGELEKALDLIFDVIADGLFIHGGKDECRYCDYSEVSGGLDLALEQSARKLESARGRGVSAWKRLRDVE